MRAITTTKVKEYLESFSIKPSAQRIAIMHFLMTNRVHPSADTIYSALVEEIPTLSRTTVYNTLWLFAEQGAISNLNIDRKGARFDYSEHPHAHFLCNCCGEIFDVEIPNNHVVKSTSNESLHVDKMEVSYHGLCNNCRNKQQSK